MKRIQIILVALAFIFSSSIAHAVPITITWTGTVADGAFAGQSAVLNFGFDTADLASVTGGTDFFATYWNTALDSPQTGFYSTATLSLGGGPNVSFVSANPHSDIFEITDGAGVAKSTYQTYAIDLSSGDDLQAGFYQTGGTPGLTNLDPAQTFTILDLPALVANIPGFNTFATFSFAGGSGDIDLASVSITAPGGTDLPVPNSLLVLVSGLICLGIRRQRKSA